jgi:peptidoglycan/xylan/chitin deacetylase (PgdA/CDA1 family)
MFFPSHTSRKGVYFYRLVILAFASVILLFSFSNISQAVHNEEKIIALTFDDGPNPKVLTVLLPLLSKEKVPGTFFVVGGNARNHPEYLREEAALGHEIENHSFGHENLKKNFRNRADWRKALLQSLKKTSDSIENAVGIRPKFFRPPFWEINPDIQKAIEQAGYRVVKLEHPDVNSMDYEDFAKHRGPDILIARVKKLIELREQNKSSWHVLVFHELPLTVEALKTIIPYFREHGYRFVRLDQILH